MGCRFGGKLEDLTTETPDILVNATSVGLEGSEEPELVPPTFFKPEMTVFDVVYRPGLTKFLTDAKSAGCTIIDGKKMLLYQGMIQFKLWTGQDAPQDVMSQALDTQ